MLQQVKCEILQGNTEIEVKGISYNSKKVECGDLFVCIAGTEHDGHEYVEEAIEKGASAIICSRPLSLKENHITVIKVEHCRIALAEISRNFYEDPGRNLVLIGITGTKGKTSTAYMLHAVLTYAGMKTGLIGTVEIDTGNEKFSSSQTTPESLEIQTLLRKMADAGCCAVIMEVSSQALKQHRVHGLHFDIGIFTNIEEDHIGPKEHRNFEEYLYYKSKLFTKCSTAIINGDEVLCEKLLERNTCEKVLYYGFEKGDLYVDHDVDYVRLPEKFAVEFQVKGMYNINLVVGAAGKFTVYNAMAALLAARELNVPQACIREALKNILIPGRQEMFPIGYDRLIMVDYAHNGMALTSLLKALKAYHPTKLTCVFGCGGERDRNRRYKMGEAAAKYADFSIITSDNPRNESPSSIISDIIYKIEAFKGKYCVIEDRREAIRYAVNQCTAGEIVVIAGKGHEDYQIIGNQKIHFDDREEVQKSIEKVKNG